MSYLRLLPVIFIFSSCSTQIFYIVRHAEKNGNTDDAGLSQAGIERGIALEEYVAAEKIDTVFTSDIRRSVLTGLSVALPQSIPQVPLKQFPQEALDKFIKRLKNIGGNKHLLVVAHTNTIPSIVLALSGKPIPAIPETEYNNMYIITIKGNQKYLVHTTYGR